MHAGRRAGGSVKGVAGGVPWLAPSGAGSSCLAPRRAHKCRHGALLGSESSFVWRAAHALDRAPAPGRGRVHAHVGQRRAAAGRRPAQGCAESFNIGGEIRRAQHCMDTAMTVAAAAAATSLYMRRPRPAQLPRRWACPPAHHCRHCNHHHHHHHHHNHPPPPPPPDHHQYHHHHHRF